MVKRKVARGGRGRASERTRRERYQRENERTERTPSTSATRFNYTLQTHDMSKSYTSYRLCHLLKVSSRAPRSRATDVRQNSTPSLSVRASQPPKTYIGRERPEIYERKVRERKGKGAVFSSDRHSCFAR